MLGIRHTNIVLEAKMRLRFKRDEDDVLTVLSDYADIIDEIDNRQVDKCR